MAVSLPLAVQHQPHPITCDRCSFQIVSVTGRNSRSSCPRQKNRSEQARAGSVAATSRAASAQSRAYVVYIKLALTRRLLVRADGGASNVLQRYSASLWILRALTLILQAWVDRCLILLHWHLGQALSSLGGTEAGTGRLDRSNHQGGLQSD